MATPKIDHGIVDIPCADAFAPFMAPRRYKGLSGGRSAAKSHFAVENLIDESMRQHIRCACVRETQLSLAESVKQLFEDKIEFYGLQDEYRITNKEIVGPNDSLFIFRGLQTHTSKRIKSLEGFNRCFIEEAQSISQGSWTDLIPTFRAEGSEIMAVWNPQSPKDPVDKFFHENADDPDVIYRHVTYRDNPWLPAASRADMERDRARDPDRYAHVWEGRYAQSSQAAVFRNWKIEAFDTPADAVFYFGADWGYSIDPTVLVRCFIKGRTLYVDREVYKVGCEIDHLPFLFAGLNNPEINKRSPLVYAKLKGTGCDWKGIPGADKWPITGDSARPETIAYMKRHGFPRMRPSIKGPGSVEEGVEFLQSYDIVVHPRCKHTADELTYYSYKVDTHTEEVIPVLADKKNHVIDSLRYSIERLRRATKRSGTW